MESSGPITIRRLESTLRHDGDGLLPVRILQCPTGLDPLNDPAPTSLPREGTLPEGVAGPEELLDHRLRGGGLTLVGWHPGLGAHDWGPMEDATVAAGLGHRDDQDRVRVAGPGGEVEAAKTCLSQNDLDNDLCPGDHVLVFEKPRDDPETPIISWAVLNCFEYTHPQVIGTLEALEVEVVVVLSANIAARQYRENALSDVHRLFAYVLHANIAECGGSGVYGPIRRLGKRGSDQQQTVGGELLGARGPGEAILDAQLSIGDLRKARGDFARYGFAAIDDGIVLDRNASMMVPSQRYIDTGDGVGCGPVTATVGPTVALDWHDGGLVTVGVAQLRSADTDTYRRCDYRLSTSTQLPRLERELERWLDHAKEFRSATGRRLDVLLLPEVFVPRSLIGLVRDFAQHHRCTVVAGFDYPLDGPDVNECAVFPRDGSPEHWYRKVTRSQYDGIEPPCRGDGRLPMERGTTLLRFTSGEGRSFGVLICYDYSHIALMDLINLERREEALDLVAVVAHNPFGELYRSGCLADAHRFYQFVAMCNVSTYGGSGIFAPMRRSGPRQVLAEVGVGTEAIAVADLDLDGLRAGRRPQAEGPRDRRFMRPSALGQRRVETPSPTAPG